MIFQSPDEWHLQYICAVYLTTDTTHFAISTVGYKIFRLKLITWSDEMY